MRGSPAYLLAIVALVVVAVVSVAMNADPQLGRQLAGWMGQR